MTPEHAELEADWLADELRRAQLLVDAATKTNDTSDKDLYLAGLEQLIGSLYNHYRIDSINPELDAQAIRPAAIRKERSGIGEFFLGKK